jgi:hypothetical protein
MSQKTFYLVLKVELTDPENDIDKIEFNEQVKSACSNLQGKVGC